MNSTASSARSRSASANTITGFLPPSSKCTRFSVAAPCAMMRRAGRAFADEADRLDVGMLGQRAARVLAEAVHGVEHARRQAGVEADLREQRRGERAPFGRLVHHRAAGRERGRDLPGREHERRIPGRDDAHGADRLADRVVEMRVGRQRQPVVRARRAVGIEAEILRAAQRRLRHVADRLAGIDALDTARSRRRAPRWRRRFCAAACAARRRSCATSRCGTPSWRPSRRGRFRPRRRAPLSRSSSLSIGECVSKVAPVPASCLPSIRCATGLSRNRLRKPSARAIVLSSACSCGRFRTSVRACRCAAAASRDRSRGFRRSARAAAP